MTATTHTEQSGAFRQEIHVDPAGHVFFADSAKSGGGQETAPSPHDLFDASLAACKALTAHVYAKQRGFPLEKVKVVVERDDSKEREGAYGLTATVSFEGAGLTDEQKTRLHDVLTRCPVHKLMTTCEVTVTSKRG